MIQRFETRAFGLVTVVLVQVSVEHLVSYCAGLTKRLIFPVWEGLNGVKTVRVTLGETDPADSEPGHDFWHRPVAVVSAYRGIGSSLNLWESAQRTGQRGGLASTGENIRCIGVT